MEKTSRNESILEMIREKGFASVEELASALYISQSSIRRDLANLEAKHLIQRTHGGATLVRDGKSLSPFYARKATNTEQKKLAAAKAAHLIQDFMSVMIDGSSTAHQILPHLGQHKGIRVFTNNVHTYLTALEYGLEAYCLGGAPSADNETLSGSITEAAVERLYTDILFFSSKCVGENGDITDPIDSETRLRKLMLTHAKTRVFLYDTSKTGSTALYKLCNIGEAEHSFSELSEP